MSKVHFLEEYGHPCGDEDVTERTFSATKTTCMKCIDIMISRGEYLKRIWTARRAEIEEREEK